MSVASGTITNLGQSAAGTTTRTDSFSHSAGAGILFHVAWRVSASGTTITSLTYDGVAATAIPNTAGESNTSPTAPWICCQAFHLPDPGSKTADIVVTWDTAPDYSYVVVAEPTGYDTVQGFDGGSNASPTTNTPTPACTHTRATENSFTFYFGARARGTATITWSPNQGQTEALDADSGVNNSLSITLCTLQETASGSLARSSTASSSGRAVALSYGLYTNFTGAGSGAAVGVGAAVGTAAADGAGSGAASFVLTAFGTAAADGAGSGTGTASGASVGAATAQGTGSGAAILLGAAIGERAQEGVGTGAATALGAGIGAAIAAGIAAGTALTQGEAFPTGGVAGAATGEATSAGAATGALLLAGVALFSCNSSGQFVAQSAGMGQSLLHVRVRIGLRLTR